MSRRQQIVRILLVCCAFSGIAAPLSAFAQATTTIQTNDGLEATVRNYFADVPAMIPIAKCESRFRQYDADGNPLDGGSGSMIGLYQINARVHAAYAKSLGMDIYTVEGNLAYARLLYNENGTEPWASSAFCWKSMVDTGNALSTSTPSLHSTLKLGVVTDEVRALQQLLNKSGFVIASDGPGSPGQETSRFGTMTRTAVQKFQCAKSIVCDGDESTSGFGVVGARTRAALLSIAN